MPERKKRARPTKKDRRKEKLAELGEILHRLWAHRDKNQADQDRVQMLTSVTDGLYTELDKLSKKAPVDQATDLVVEHVNEVVQDVRTLLPDDPYIQRLKPFVPAGDNPEHRDVILVLKQLLQGLGRAVDPLSGQARVVRERIALVEGLRVALGLYVEHGETQITEDALKAKGVSLPPSWFQGRYGHKTVALELIDQYDVRELLDDIE